MLKTRFLFSISFFYLNYYIQCLFVRHPTEYFLCYLFLVTTFWLCLALPAAPGSLQVPPSASQSSSVVVNGIQPATHHNGVSADGDLGIMQQQGGRVGDPRLTFEGAEPFLMKTAPMKPQHVAGTTDPLPHCPPSDGVSGRRDTVLFVSTEVLWVVTATSIFTGAER